MRRKTLAILAILMLYCGAAHGVVIRALPDDGSGHYDSFGTSSGPSNSNYVAGLCLTCSQPGLYRNLRIDTSEVRQGGFYTLWSVESDLGRLMEGGSGLIDVYNDLGTGVRFGGSAILANQDDITLEIELNAMAVASINENGGLWAIGGNYASSQTAFGHTNHRNVRELVVTQVVPLPGAFGLFLVALLSLGSSRPLARLSLADCNLTN